MANKIDMVARLNAGLKRDLARQRAESRGKRSMPPEELAIFLRESARGNGIQGTRKAPRDRNWRDWD